VITPEYSARNIECKVYSTLLVTWSETSWGGVAKSPGVNWRKARNCYAGIFDARRNSQGVRSLIDIATIATPRFVSTMARGECDEAR